MSLEKFDIFVRTKSDNVFILSGHPNFMLYKLYIMTMKEEYMASESRPDFEKLYKEHDVQVVGEWVNADNPREFYFMTGYKDKDHYDSFVSAMKNNETYQNASKKLGELRETVKGVTLQSSGQ